MLTTMMMTDQMLDLSPSLSSEVPMMHHTINADASQQVILVQVNPGETFTIRTEDGNLQCIQGPAEVPMMSPNGSIPPIHVPPGYVSQVLEDNTGVRRVVVTPHSECFAPGYSPALSVSHHLHPAYLTHPYFLQASHTYYPPLSASDVLPHYLYQHRLPPVYPEEIIPLFNVSTIMTHEEYCKPPPKKLKQPLERPPQSQVTGHPAANGYSKSHTLTAGGESPDNKRTDRRARGSPKHTDAERHDEEGDMRRVPAVMSGLDRPQAPQVCNVQSCSALVLWTPVSPSAQTPCCSYELQLKEIGHDGKYKIVYCGEELQFTLTDLRPATDYHVRVNVVTLSMKGQCSEAKAFTTHCAPPDVPLPPRLAHRSKSSLTLQWKPPVDNGSKITNYVLVWDEGKKNRAFCEVYVGHQRHCKVTKLSPASGYMFRLAALNDTGNSGFSPEVVFYTSGCLPQASFPPQLVSWGPSWVMLEWTRPNSCRSEEQLAYILEMQEESKGLDFQAVYSGSESSQKVTSLQRNTQYSFRLITCSGGLCSAPSSPVVCKTTPDRPGPPLNLSVYDVFSHRFSVAWELPPDNGGCGDLTYVLQLSEETSEDQRWETLYKGPERNHVFQGVKPATSFVLRVGCVGAGGQSPWCESVKMRTLSPLPERCQPPRIVGTCTHEELTLQWDAPICAAAGERVEFSLEMCVSGGSAEPLEVFRGPHTQCTVGQLLPGTTYRFQVRAQNDAGYGPYSECMELSTAAGPPPQCDPPDIIVTSHTCAVVKWQNMGGSGLEVSEYRLGWGRGTDFLSLVYRGTETCFRICNLEAATDYCCRVQAVNQVGAGPHSELVTCRTPAAVPDAVSGVRLLDHLPDHSSFSRSSCLALTWDEPRCNGADIMSYTIIMGDIVINSQNPVCHIIQDLLPDSEYSLQIRAENEMGPGPFSQSLTARTRPRPPSPPPLECVAAGPQSLKLRWGFRNTDSPTYILEMEDRSQRFVAVYRGPSHSFKIQRLSEFCCYHFRIQALSMAGKGPYSETCSFSTTKSLPPTPKAPGVEQLEGNSCEVTWERIPPMRGDRVSYVLQVLGGRESEFRQVYKGEETSFTLCGLQRSTEYRLRVLACRRCTDTLQDLCSSFSASTRFSLRRVDAVTAPDTDPVRPPAQGTLTDEKLASVIVLAAAALSGLAAFLLQLLL